MAGENQSLYFITLALNKVILSLLFAAVHLFDSTSLAISVM